MADISTVDIVDINDLKKQVDAGIAEAKRFFDYVVQGNADLKAATTVSGINTAANTANTGVNGSAAAVASTAVIKSIQDNTKAQKDNDTASQSRLKTTKALTIEQATQNELVKQTNANLRAQAREALGLTDAYTKLVQQQKESEKAAKDLQAQALTNPALQAQADALSKQANDFNTSLKAIDATVGNFQRNVGNYNAGAQVIVDALDKEQKKLQDLEATRVRVQNAGSTSFNPGSVAAERPQITGFAGGNSAASPATMGSIQELQVLDSQIAQSRTIVEGFQKTVQDPEFLNISGKAGSSAKSIDLLKTSLSELQAQGLGNTDAAKSISGFITDNDVNRFRNYTNALGILKTQYDAVSAEINKNTAAGRGNSAENQKLIEEQSLLKTFVNQQTNGYLSLTRELQATTRQYQSLVDSQLQDSDVAKELNEIIIQQTRHLRELRNDQALLASESPKLQALTIAAKGLAGVYAAGSGAIALFGDETGKLSEKLNQLVGIQTLLQGLTEFNEFLTKRSAVTTALFGESEAIAANATKQKTTSIVADTVAIAVNTEAQEAATVATTETTAAVEGEGVVMTETAAATTGLNTALNFIKENPITLALVALAAILVIVYENVNKTEEELLAAIVAEGSFAEAINATTAAIKEQIDLTNESTDATKRNLEQKLAVAEKEGTNQANIFAIRKQILALDKDQISKEQTAQAKQGINQTEISKNLNSQLDLIKKLNLEREKLTNAQKPENGANNVINADGSFGKINTVDYYAGKVDGTTTSASLITDKLSDNKKILDAATKTVQDLQKVHDDAQALALRAEKNGNDIEQELAEERKFASDQQREDTLNNAQDDFNNKKFLNDKILADTKSSLNQRLAAIQSNFDAEKKLREKQNEEIQNDPTKNPAEKRKSANELRDYEGYIDKNGKPVLGTGQITNTDAQNKEIEDAGNAYLALQQRITAVIIDANAKAQEKIYTDESKSFTERTSALAKYNLDQQTLIQNAGNQELEAKGLFAQEGAALDDKQQAEKLAIETETANKLHDLAIKTAEDQLKINIDTNNQLTADIDRTGQTGLVNQEASDFAKSRNNKQFERQRKIDEDKARDAKLQNDLVGAQNQANDFSSTATDASRKQGADAAQDIQNNITANTTQSGIDQRDKDEADKKEKIKTIEDLSLKSIDTIQKAEDARFDATQKRLEAEVAATQKAEDDKKSALNDNTLNALDKSLAIQKADKDAALKKQQLQNQEKANDIKKAETDKAIGIAKIILNTAVGATSAIDKGPLFVAAAIAEGALELAAAEAVQIPRNFLGAGIPGRPSHTGGLMIVGDRGTTERITEPGKSPYIVNSEQMIDAPALTKVEPLYGKEAEDYINNNSVRKMNLAAIRYSNDMRMADHIVAGVNGGLRRLGKEIKNSSVPTVTRRPDIRNSSYIQKVVKGK